MIKLNTMGLVLLILALSFIAKANTVHSNIDQHKPVDMNNKQWSSLKTAVQEVKLLPSAGGGADHNFGNSVSVDGNHMVVGAPNYSLNTIAHGAVYVFDFDGTTWTESQILTPFDGNNGDQFGISVSLSGTQLLIGANKDDDADNDAGVVFVYNFDGVSWQFTQKLIADDAASGYKFGGSLSLSGNRALIGSDKAGGDINITTGAAYIFEFSNNLWSQTARLLASDADDADNFGVSVSLFGDKALVGNSNNNDAGADSGSAYIFEFDGTDWLEITKFTASNAGFNHRFGSSVSLSNNRVLIGASGENSSGTNTGAAYIFEFNNKTWTQTQKLNATDAQANAKFGNSVSLIGNRVLITAVTDTNKGAAYVFNFNGNTWSLSQKLTASDATAQDEFGFAASLTNDRFVVGAHLDDSNGNNSGSVYVFYKNGINWSQSQKVLAVAGTQAADGYFGSVSISNNRALIGVPGDGCAYIFDFDGNNWIQTQKIIAVNGSFSNRFGISVSLSGNRALIGASNQVNFSNNIGFNGGAAYIFDFDGDNWTQTRKIMATDGAAGDRFGFSVSLSGNRALVGAFLNDGHIISSGSAYIFNFNGTIWTQTTKIIALDGETGDDFGNSVSLSGNRALIGAQRDNDHGFFSGSAYIFDFDGSNWSLTNKITALDGEASDQFGGSVSLSGNRALIGAQGDVDGNPRPGSAYIFDFDGTNWTQATKIIAPDGESGDEFGVSVSLSGNRALIGAGLDDDNGFNAGAAYIFNFDGINWTQTTKITAIDGESSDSFGGSVSMSGNRVLIGATGEDDRGSNSGSAYIFNDINDLIFENSFEN